MLIADGASRGLRFSLALGSEAEAREQCVPRQSLGTRKTTRGVDDWLAASKFSFHGETVESI